MDAFCKDSAALMAGDFSQGTRRIVINAAIWQATEGDGRKSKYVGGRFWSQGEIDDVKATGFANLSKRLRHEHVVPRGLVVSEIPSLQVPTPESVQRALDTYAIGCVVTLDEMRRLDRGLRKSMPDGWNDPGRAAGPDIRARYTKAQVAPVGTLQWEGHTARLVSGHSLVVGGT